MTHCKIFVLPALLLALLTVGCGYHIGTRGMMHPQIKSIAVADVKNETLEPLASNTMRMQLAEQFQVDGALKLKNMGESDCVIYATIKKVTNDTIRSGSVDYDITYRPQEFRLRVYLEFTVIIPGRGEPLIPTRTVIGYTDYLNVADPAVSRTNALKYACAHAAKLAVQYTTEAW